MHNRHKCIGRIKCKVIWFDFILFGSPVLGRSWARSFARRFRLVHRKCDTDRRDDNDNDVFMDNEWKKLVEQTIAEYSVDDDHILAMGSFLFYFILRWNLLKLLWSSAPYTWTLWEKTRKGNFQKINLNKKVSFRKDRRNCTCSPVVSRSNQLILMQLIFKGKTKNSLPKFSEAQRKLISSKVFFYFFKKKIYFEVNSKRSQTSEEKLIFWKFSILSKTFWWKSESAIRTINKLY